LYRVFDESGEFIARLAMAYPPLKLAMEYDGRGHLDAWQQASDARRLNLLDAAGWSVLRFTATDVMRSRHYGRPGPRGLPAPLRRSRVVNSSTPTSRPERRFAARRGSWTWG